MAYKSVSTFENNELIRFENEGDSIEGTLMALRKDVLTKNGLATLADLTTLDGKEVSLFVTAGLTSRLTDQLIGEQVKITFVGNVKNPKTGRTFKGYNVEVWSDDGGA